MKNTYTIIRSQEFACSSWNGGTTTQLAICPEEASYAARDFAWRISTARVEAEESEFTPLPGVERIIMVLEGELLLRHEGHGEFRLGQYDTNRFRGDWKTTSRGRVVDFNVMLKDAEGDLRAIRIEGGRTIGLFSDSGWATSDRQVITEALYFTSDAQARIDGCETISFHRGDLLLARASRTSGTKLEVDIQSAEEIVVIHATIWHK